MSVEWTRLVWKLEMPTTRKIVLLALADKADRDGRCWPSRGLLSEMTGLAQSRVSLHLGDLIDAGFVEQERRHRQSAVYTFVRARFDGTLDVPIGDVDSKINVPIQDVSDRDVSIQDVSLLHGQSLESGHLLLYTNHQEPSLVDEPPVDQRNPEAEQLCNRLAELIVANGSKKPAITKRWKDSARLLLSRDQRPHSEAIALIEWCQADSFWSTNILSLPTFRDKYDQLRLKAVSTGALARKAEQVPAGKDELTEWLREQWQESSVVKIQKATGIRYEQPDIPIGVDTAEDQKRFFRDHRRKWIEHKHEAIMDILTAREAAA